jgi:hypothetical protein
LSSCWTAAAVQGDAVTASRAALGSTASQALDAASALLERQGYVVQPGELRFFDIQQCAPAGVSCLGNNPSSAYGTFWMPPAPDEPTAGLANVWHLRPDEAIVFVGRTPPPAAYYSFTDYLIARQGQLLAANIGDSLNQLVIQTAGAATADGSTPGPFDALALVITTADATLEGALRSAFAQAGFPAAAMNADVMALRAPLSLNLGTGSGADTFSVIYRIALFADESAGRTYMSAPPVQLLRVTPAQPASGDVPARAPLPRLPLDGSSEVMLAEHLDQLEGAIQARFGGGGVASTTTPNLLYGEACIALSVNCAAATPDAVFSRNTSPLQFNEPGSTDGADFYVVYGVNHKRTGKTVYTNVTLFFPAKALGVEAVADQLDDSANAYLSGADELYAYVFARDCTGLGAGCVAVPTSFPGLPQGESFTFIERAYLDPATKTRPSALEILRPRVLAFHRPQH